MHVIILINDIRFYIEKNQKSIKKITDTKFSKIFTAKN